MATATANKNDLLGGFDFEGATDRVREFNEQLLGSWKQQGAAALDAYQSAFDSIVDFEKKMADAMQLEWVSALTDAHVNFVTTVSDAYTSAVREVLK